MTKNELETLLKQLEELKSYDMIPSNVYRRLYSLVMYKCRKCKFFHNGKCTSHIKSFKIQKNCYYNEKLLVNYLFMLEYVKNTAYEIVYKYKHQYINEMYDNLIDGFLSIYNKIPPSTHEKILNEISNFCIGCSICNKFKENCNADSKYREKNNCHLSYERMQNLLDENTR